MEAITFEDSMRRYSKDVLMRIDLLSVWKDSKQSEIFQTCCSVGILSLDRKGEFDLAWNTFGKTIGREEVQLTLM